MTSYYDVISDLVDLIILESPVQFEGYNYESVKEIAVMNSIEQVRGIINNIELYEEEREQSLVSLVAYLLMENTMMHVQRIGRNGTK